MKIDDIRTVLVVGAGTMGQQIAMQCAVHGFTVMLHDISAAALDAAMGRVRGYANQLVAAGALSRSDADAALARIQATDDPEEAAKNADLLSESVPEDVDLKRKVFAQFDKLCPRRTIFTTDTSSLLASMLAESTGRAAQFAAFHFHAPMQGANVVDIMPHPGTSGATVELLQAFAGRIGQIPILLNKESPDYVYNAMGDAWLGAAIRLYDAGVASFEDIDRAWMGCTHMKMGPFGALDWIGLDTARAVGRARAQLGDEESAEFAAFFEPYVEQGKLGVKSGQGFYRYPNPAFAEPDFLAPTLPPTVVAEGNKARLRQIIDAFNAGDRAAPFKAMAPDCLVVDERGLEFEGAAYKERLDEVLAVFPDYHIEIEDLLAVEDKVIARYTETATMKGDFMGVPATGKKIRAPGIEIWRFADGKVTGLWMARDTTTVSMQAGIIPEPG